MRHSRSRLRHSMVVLSVVLAGCGTAPDGAASTEDDCAGTTIIGIRGQGQSLDANGGLGREVKGIAAALADDLGGDVRTEAIRHRSRLGSMADYTADVADGRRLLAVRLRTEVAECPDSRLVVIGFSQGSQIAREGLADQPKLARSVDALVLVGSAVHDPGSPVTRVDLPGPEPDRAGSLGPGPDLGDLAARTVEACIIGDDVCALPPDRPQDYAIHQHAYEDPDVARAIAAATVAVLKPQ